MSLFSGSKKSRRNLRRKVVHSISDGETEDQVGENQCSSESSNMIEGKMSEKVDFEGALSFLDQEAEDDFTEFKLKRPEYSHQQIKGKSVHKKHQVSLKLEVPETEVEKTPSSVLSQLSEGVIPSAAAIHAARKKRELARNLGSDSGGNKINFKKQSNLISDDEDDDDDDENSDGAVDGPPSGIRQFGITTDNSKQMEVLSAMDNAASGSDEEKFVEEQIHKGVYSFPTSTTDSKCIVADYSDNPNVFSDGVTVTNEPVPKGIVLTPISVESVKSQLQCQLMHLKEQRARNSDLENKLENDMLTANDEIIAMDGHSSASSLRYQFFQEVKGYVRDLTMCLTEKVPEIKKLKDSALKFFIKTSELLIERRRQDIKDMADECSGKPSTLDQVCHSRIVEREGRRRRRRELRSRSQTKITSSDMHNEGQSSDDELLESTKIKLQSELDEIISRKDQVFTDALDDFSNISSVAQRFREWKFSFPTSYNQAYISLCLPKLLAPYVHLQFITWNPLNYSDHVILDNMPWMQDLLFFEYRDGCEIDKTDSDIHLIPKIIELTTLPKISDLIEKVWDPLSSTQTLHLKACIQHLIQDFSLDHQTFQSLFKLIIRRINMALEYDIFIPIFPSEVMNCSSSQQYIFSQRQFWTSFKLMNNVLQWQGMIPDDALLEIVIDGLLNRYILLSLQNSPATTSSVTKIEKIMSILPSGWWNSAHLSGLSRYLANLIEVLQSSLLTEPESNRCNIRSAIDRALLLLKKTGSKNMSFDVSTI